MRKVTLVTVLALAGFACADGVGQMLTDAGEVLTDAGTSLQDGAVPDAGAQDEPVTCDKSETRNVPGYAVTARWAEFEVDPGVTEVTICQAVTTDTPFWPPQARSNCYRTKAQWLRGTSTGWVACGYRTVSDDGTTNDNPDPISITVHR